MILMNKKMQIIFVVLAMCVSWMVAGCGGGGSSSQTSKTPEQSQTKTSEAPKGQDKEAAPSELNGKPVTDEMLQSFRDSVTEEEMSLFTDIAKHTKFRYNKAQVRDIAARMKMVGIDFSLIEQGKVAGDILRDGLSFKIISMSDEEKFSFAYGCYVFVQLQKDDKSKVVAIDLSVKESNQPFNPIYTLYKNDKIIGDFSDVIITSEIKGIIIEKIQEYVSNLGGNIKKINNRGTLDIRISCTWLKITKEALSEESKWKGNDSGKFSFPIILVKVGYNAPSEVYGEKEQEKHERFLFNKNGELVIALPDFIPEQKKSHYNKLLLEKLENVKL